jgi:hypothetical protein
MTAPDLAGEERTRTGSGTVAAAVLDPAQVRAMAGRDPGGPA